MPAEEGVRKGVDQVSDGRELVNDIKAVVGRSSGRVGWLGGCNCIGLWH